MPPKKRTEIRKMQIGQIYLDIDAAAGTTMSNFENRDLSTIGFLKYDITALPYHVVHNGDVLIIGIGAGRDILTGLLFNQKSITGVEINDTILDVHKRLLAKFSGDLSRHPKVTFVHNEARSYINASQRQFDLIQLSLIDTFAATQAGAYALTENNLYTVEGLTAYFKHLTEQGFVSISYWMHPGSPEAMLRLTGAATKALASQGITHVRDHMVIVHKDGSDNGRGVANLLVKKTPFSKAELAEIDRYCAEMGFHLILSPEFSVYDSFASMTDPQHLEKFVKSYKTNISPATDDQPFFFLITRLNIWKFLSDFKLFSFSAENILFSLLGVMLILTGFFVVLPLLAESGRVAVPVPKLPFTIYFTAIGLAFMFIEMSQLTRLSSFLGHPVYSLSIVLFSFLISSGLGSNFLGCIDNRRQMLIYSGVFIVICILSIFFTIPALEFFSKYPIGVRLFLSVCLVFPLGFFMGSFLPQGMRLLGQKKGPVALYWGLNGATSVLGSILAMIFQITWGLNITFSCGVLLYLVAIGTLLKLKFSTAS